MPPPDPTPATRESDLMPGRWTAIGIASVVATLIVTIVVMTRVLAYVEDRPRPVDRPRSVVNGATLRTDAPPLQPSWRHDASPSKDLATLRADENKTFEALGWTIDPESGEPRVPDEIVALVAARSTPAPTTTTSTTREAR